MNSAELKNWFEMHRQWLESETQKELDRLARLDEEIIIQHEEDPDYGYELERDNSL